MFTGVKIGDVFLDSIPGQVFKFKQNSTLFDTDIPKGEYSMPVVFPMTDEIIKKLNLYNRVNYKDKFERRECTIIEKGISIKNGILVIDALDSKFLKGYILTGTSMISEQLKTNYLDDIDYGTPVDPGATETLMVAHMLDTITNPDNHNHIFGMLASDDFNKEFLNDVSTLSKQVINYYSPSSGDFPENTQSMVNYSAHVPFVKLAYVCKKIYEQFGYTLDWELLEDSTFKKLVLPNNRALIERYDVTRRIQMDGALEIDLPGNGGGTTGYGPMVKTATGNANIVGSFPNYTNISMENNSPAPLQDDDGFFDMSTGKLFIPADGLVIDFYYTVDLKRHNFIDYSGTGIVCATDYNLFGQIELSIDGEYLASQITTNCITEDDSAYTNYAVFRTSIAIPEGKIGRYIDFKFGVVYQNDLNEFYLVSYYAKSISMKITFQESKPYELPSYEIDYANHLAHMTCSEFMNSIRNRFGAYVSEIDTINKIVRFGQLNDVVKSLAESRFNIRDELFGKKSIEQSHQWKYNFDAGEEAFWSPFYNKTIGDADADITHNEYNFDIGPVFYRNHKNYLYIGSKNMTGITKSDDKTAVTMNLAFYLGMQDRGDTELTPLISSDNDAILSSAVVPWSLKWRESDGLYATFLESFWKYFVEYMEVEFTVYPDTVEKLNFRYDNVDFYNYMRFLVKEIDFEMSDEVMRPTKAVMVKLDL